MTSTKEYVVGAKLPPSGLFIKDSATAAWRHAGFNLPFLFALDYSAEDPSILFLAAGNGLIQASEHGEKWKLLTGSDVTELRDVSVDRNAPGTVYFAHSRGIRVTHDRGATWQELSGPLHRKFTEAVRVDRTKAGTVLIGGEEGIFRTGDGGATWKPAGAAGFQISRLEQSPHDACEWLAATQAGGMFASQDCGKSFENSGGRVGVGANLYDIAFDPSDARRMAVVGWGPGVAVSEDHGKTWELRNTGLPTPHVVSVAFDPARAGRMYVSVNDEAVYRSDDTGKTWTKDGLEGSAVYRMRFVPK